VGAPPVFAEREPVVDGEVGVGGFVEEARSCPGRVAERVDPAAGVGDGVDRRVAADEVVAGFAIEGIGAEAAGDQVAAGPAPGPVVADPAVEAVIAFAAVEPVVAASAEEGVVAAFPEDGGYCARRSDRVVTGRAEDRGADGLRPFGAGRRRVRDNGRRRRHRKGERDGADVEVADPAHSHRVANQPVPQGDNHGPTPAHPPEGRRAAPKQLLEVLLLENLA
jgi:hypothetical protein